MTRRLPKRLVGRWRITAMSCWDREDIDLVEPGFIEFAADGTGQVGFIAVTGWLDCRASERDGSPGVEFTWEGVDDTIEGHLFFHQGDDSTFRAKPFTGAEP